MSNPSDLPNNRLELLAEFHKRARALCLWAGDTYTHLSQPEPDWDRVQSHFQLYGDLRKWLTDNWGALELFEFCRIEAVVWCGQGWRNWHATVVESLVHTGFHEPLGVWLGTPEDQNAEYIVLPDELDWRDGHQALRDDVSNLNRCRATAWQRIRQWGRAPGAPPLPGELPSAAFPLMEGWSLIDHFDPWTHIPHLRSEYRATKRLLDPHAVLVDRWALPGAPPNSGPGPRQRFYWNGKDADFAKSALCYRLCRSLWDFRWNAPAAQKPTLDVRRDLWPDDSDSEEKLANLVQRVRQAFEGAGMAITIQIPRGAGIIWLQPEDE
jgi:hypothetical protein